MKRVSVWVGAVVLVLILLCAALWMWKKEEINRLSAVNSLFDTEKIVSNFSNMGDLFLSVPVSRGDGPVTPLPAGAALDLPTDFAAWVEARQVTGIVVLKDGLLRHEGYFLGTGADDLRISWSVAKSFLSTLMGVILEQGEIQAISDPVTQYAPALKGTAYDGASIEDVLQMESGVRFNENYFDFWSDINRMGRVLALGQSMDSFAAGLSERDATAGERWHYVSIDTHVLGMVIRGATGRSVADLMSEYIIAPLGMEREPYYLTDGYETAFVLGGLNLTTRDYARFGQLVIQNGMWQGEQRVPAKWLAASTRPSANTSGSDLSQYGYQWWMPIDATDGEFFARGVYGQYIYINRPLGVVIATNSADKRFADPGVNASNIKMFRALSVAAQ